MQKQLYSAVALILLLTTALAACRSPDLNYRYYRLHPTVLSKAYAKCSAADLNDQSSTHCQVVIAAYVDTQTLLRQASLAPFVFGQDLLLNQMQLATLEAQRDHLNIPKGTPQYQRAIDNLKHEIADRQHKIDYQLMAIAALQAH